MTIALTDLACRFRLPQSRTGGAAVLCLALGLSAALAPAPVAAQKVPANQAPQQQQPAAVFDDYDVAVAREQFLAGDHAGALAVLRPAAEMGIMRAQNLMGAAHQYGMGVPVDAAEAVRWFTTAAELGYPAAMYNLGYLYELGMPGLEPDFVLARNWYQQAAIFDYGPALGALGGMQMNGAGGPVDEEQGVWNLTRARELGDKLAYEWYGYMYWAGIGVPQDYFASRENYYIAALLGSGNGWAEYGARLEFGEGGELDIPGAEAAYREAIALDAGRGAVNLIFLQDARRDLYPDLIETRALCLWLSDWGTTDEIGTVSFICDSMRLSPDQERSAAKMADRF